MPIYCCVKFCKRNSIEDKEHSFFRLPNNPVTREEWIQFATGGKGSTISKTSRLCSDHFERKYIFKMYPRPLLGRDAVPTLRENKSNRTEELPEDSPKRKQFESESSGTSSRELKTCVSEEKKNVPSDVELTCNNVQEVRISGKNFKTFSIRDLGDCIITVRMKT